MRRRAARILQLTAPAAVTGTAVVGPVAVTVEVRVAVTAPVGAGVREVATVGGAITVVAKGPAVLGAEP